MKKRKLAPNLFTEDDDPSESGSKDVDTKVDKLFTLLLAYAIAGTTSIAKRACADRRSLSGADSTLFVQVPLKLTCPRDYFLSCGICQSVRSSGSRALSRPPLTPPQAPAKVTGSFFQSMGAISGKPVACQ